MSDDFEISDEEWKKILRGAARDMEINEFVYAPTLEETKEKLQSGKVSVNARESDGKTALMCAQTPEQTEFLLSSGAKTTLVDAYGRNALFHVKSPEQAEMLINAGPDALLYQKDKNGQTAAEAIKDWSERGIIDKTTAKAITDVIKNATEKAEKRKELEKRKSNLRKSFTLRQELKKRHSEERVSGAVIADEIAGRKISGEETRTITPEVGAELAMSIAKDRHKR